MQVLVIGGTGYIGSALTRALYERDLDVTVFARSPDETSLPSEVDRVAGDVRSELDLAEAMADVDVAVNLVALSPLRIPKGGEEMHDAVHRQGTANVVAAAEDSDVDRLVQMSALGADPDAPTHALRAKGRAEEIVAESSLPATVFRPSVIFGEGGEFVSFTRKLTPPFLAPLPGGGKTKFQPIWLGDFVPMMADAVEDDDHAGATYDIGGPEVLTLAEVAKLSRQALGQSTTIIPVPMPLAGVGLSIMGAVPGFPFGADQYRSLQMDNVTEHNDVSAFGVSEAELKTLREYLGLADAAQATAAA
jgi:uncharacterized protein YbjT (DUF2867 family)